MNHPRPVLHQGIQHRAAGVDASPEWKAGYKAACEDIENFDKNVALVEAQDEIDRLRQGLWDVAIACGFDHDGDLTPGHLAYPDIVVLALEEVRQLRAEEEGEASAP